MATTSFFSFSLFGPLFVSPRSRHRLQSCFSLVDRILNELRNGAQELRNKRTLLGGVAAPKGDFGKEGEKP